MKLTIPDCEHCKSRKNSLFHFCHLEELGKINDEKSCSVYKRGQILFQEGGNPMGMYCVNEGKVKLYKYASDGKEQIVRIAKPGDFIGYKSLLAGTRYPVSASALEDAQICIIPKHSIMELFKENEGFSKSMIEVLCSTIDETYAKMADLAYKPVRGRIAEALLFLNKFYKDEKNPEGIITITREDLASFVGTVKETTIRMLREFKDEGLIETEKSDIRLLNVPKLTKIAELYD